MSQRLERDRRVLAMSLAGVAAAVAGGAVGAGVHRRRRTRSAPESPAEARVRRLVEDPWKGNWGVLDEVVSPEYVGWVSGLPEPIEGREALRERLQSYADAFPDARVSVQDQLAGAGRVATRWVGRGTHAGDLPDIAASGKEVTISGMTVSRLERGKIVEQWITWDRLGLLVQLGAVAAPAEA